MRILRVATVPFFVLHHLEGQIRATVAAGHEVFVITSPGEGAERIRELGVAGVTLIDIPREISPVGDLVALFRLRAAVARLRPDLVHSTTPKAGLLAALAAWMCRVPVRLHTFTGQAWAERSGFVRWVSRFADRVIVALNSRCYADSFSQRDYLVAQGIAPAGTVHVQGQGSLAGVDLQRFDSGRLQLEAAAVRSRLAIPAGAKVVVFVGRVTRDKGVAELVEAFVTLKNAVLLLVGPLEPERDPLPDETLAEIRRNSAIHALGYDERPERYLAAADVLCLPSYREGFGIVVLEAAALGVPCVGTRIVGLADAVVDGKTGILVAPKDSGALAAALQRILGEDTLRAALGHAARERARSEFDAKAMQKALLAEYGVLYSRVTR